MPLHAGDGQQRDRHSCLLEAFHRNLLRKKQWDQLCRGTTLPLNVAPSQCFTATAAFIWPSRSVWHTLAPGLRSNKIPGADFSRSRPIPFGNWERWVSSRMDPLDYKWSDPQWWAESISPLRNSSCWHVILLTPSSDLEKKKKQSTSIFQHNCIGLPLPCYRPAK